MKLELDDKWKWAAMDESGKWHACTVKLERHTSIWAFDESGDGDWVQISGIVKDLPTCPWQDSLHQIINGELVKHVELKVDDKVMVRDGDCYTWMRRRFCKFASNGDIMCFADGRDSWSAKGNSSIPFLREYAKWRLPTPEELA